MTPPWSIHPLPYQVFVNVSMNGGCNVRTNRFVVPHNVKCVLQNT
jgi:hypothetical protein